MWGRRYFLQLEGQPEREVSLQEYCSAERRAGFMPKPGCGPRATASFIAVNGGVRGRTEPLG